jgi:tRNA (mo5U34)-methyltransferase
MNAIDPPTHQDLPALVQSVIWYHTIDLGNGLVTPGIYDHRPYLRCYRLPEQLYGKRVLDVGAASGFFSFELERRGAQVTATDLPTWLDHDFAPNYQFDLTPEEAQSYLHQPFEIAKTALGSQVQRQFINIYDITPKTTGMFDLVFCGSVLIHLTDPLKALWNIASVTQEKAIIATVISEIETDHPTATLLGHYRGDAWWAPTRRCLELMAVAAGFVGVEWIGEFTIDYRNGERGPYHGVIHAYKTTTGWGPGVRHRDDILRQPIPPTLAQPGATTPNEELTNLQAEIGRLRTLVHGYEQGRFMRLMRWLHRLRRNR